MLPTDRGREAQAAKLAKHVASSLMYYLLFELNADPSDIIEFIRHNFTFEHAKIAMEHSTYDVETKAVTFVHTADQDDKLNEMAAEDWIDMSILDSEPVLNIGMMDSGVLFDHDNDEHSLSSINTAGYMARNRRTNTTVTGFKAAAQYKNATTDNTPTEQYDETVSPTEGAAQAQSNSPGTVPQESPPLASASVVGATKE